MKELHLQDAPKYQRTVLIAKRQGTGLKYGIQLIKLLGKGSNNAVYLAQDRNGQKCVVRQPRSNSDTQRVGNASWEFRNTAIAVRLGVCPKMFDAWYVRHGTKLQKSGLHIVCDYYPNDVHELLEDYPYNISMISSKLCQQTVSHLKKMADNFLFCYDVKPSNMVFKPEPDLDVKFIDFGRDFCEWRPYSETNEYLERAPVTSFIQTLADEHAEGDLTPVMLYSDLMFTVMLIMLSANIAFVLDHCKEASRASFAERCVLNFMAEAAGEARKNMRGKHVKLVKEILRHREIRDTIRHYMGRRNCGTKRTFYYAGFTKK
jgi:hypothetical protein